MKDSMEVIKKIGAFLVVFILVLMLAITFSSQPIDEIISMISGSSKVGSFQKEPILVKDYSIIYNECENYFQKFGFTDLPPFLLQNCIYQQVLNLYVKPVIAEDLGLGISKESVENQIIENVKEIYKMQKKNTLPEDRISIEELYTREVSYFPVHKRVALIKANFLDNFLLNPIPLSSEDEEILKKLSSNQIKIKSSILIFSNNDLLKNIKVNITEEEIQKKYEEDKKEYESNPQNKDKYPALKERYNFIKEKIENEKKRQELSKIKEELGKLKNQQSFDEYIKILKINPIQKEFSFSELESIYIDKDIKINANKQEVLKGILEDHNLIIGPIQDRDYTFYIKIESIKIENAEEGSFSKDTKESMEKRQTGIFYEYILEQYKNRGEFKLYDLTKQEQKKQK